MTPLEFRTLVERGFGVRDVVVVCILRIAHAHIQKSECYTSRDTEMAMLLFLTQLSQGSADDMATILVDCFGSETNVPSVKSFSERLIRFRKARERLEELRKHVSLASNEREEAEELGSGDLVKRDAEERMVAIIREALPLILCLLEPLLVRDGS